jgi:hypothetical protein
VGEQDGERLACYCAVKEIGMAWTAVADLLGLTQPAVSNTVTRAERKAVDGKLNFDEPQNAKVMGVLNKPRLFSGSQIRPQEESRSVILRANKVEVLRPRVPSSKMMTRFLCPPRSEFRQKCIEHGAWSRTSSLTGAAKDLSSPKPISRPWLERFEKSSRRQYSRKFLQYGLGVFYHITTKKGQGGVA